MPPKVFVSYSHDSPAHKQRVREFVSCLRGQGVTVVFDEDVARTGGPDDGWPWWCERQIVESDYVLACCTAMFHERFDGPQQPDTGQGTAWEAQMIRQYLYENPRENRKIRPLILDETDRPHIPVALRCYTVFLASDEGSYAGLLRWLTVTPALAAPPPSPVAWLPPSDDFMRRLADRTAEFDRFKGMLAGRTAHRALLIQGPSSSGKTALIQECISYAEHRGVPYASVDFKGGLPLEEVFASMVLDLGQDMLRDALSCLGSGRSHAVIADLQRLRQPLLLVFDTYEDATQNGQTWVETQLLPRLGRCPAIVVVIAGRKVPEQSARSWAPLACTVALPPIRRVEDWFDFAKRNYGVSPLKREHVEAITVSVDGNPGLVSATLETLVRRLPSAQAEPAA
jgi:hypothetical protein